MKKSYSKKSAFSLIELSIVLVIIGLLIAGLTGGASLIRASELRAVISEARGIASGVNSFYSQYSYLPGDYNIAIGNAKVGDGNGKLEYFNSVTASATATPSESSNAFIAMRTIGAIDTTTSTSAPVEAGTTAPVFATTAPPSKIKAAGWALDYRNYSTAPFTNEPSSQNVAVLTGTIGTSVTASTNTLVNGTNVASAAIYATDAASIDAKADDSNAGTGFWRGLNPGTGTLPTAASTNSATNCYYYASSTFTYNTTNATKSCAMTYQIDVTNAS